MDEKPPIVTASTVFAAKLKMMVKRDLTLLLCFACLVAMSGCARTQAAHTETTAPTAHDEPNAEVIRLVKNPDPAPDFQINDLEGKPISLSGAHGKVVLLNFWATWCGPCRAEIADLVALQKQYADKLEIIALATEEDDADQVRRFVLRSGINYRVAMAPDDVVRAYGGVSALPTSFVIDAQGRVVQKHVGLNDPSLYERELKAILGIDAGAKVEYFEDNGQVFLKNAERATELPGVDLSKLTPQQRSVALRRMNANSCNCGCSLTLAQCRINDTECRVSLTLANQIVSKISTPGAKHPTTNAPAAAKAPSRTGSAQ